MMSSSSQRADSVAATALVFCANLLECPHTDESNAIIHREVTVKKLFSRFHVSRFLVAAGLLVLVSAAVLADTVKLKNGSVIKGKVVGYSGGEFTVVLDLGSSSRRSTSRMIIAIEDIESIEFDSTSSSAEGGAPESRPESARENKVESSQPTRETSPPPATASDSERTTTRDAADAPSVPPLAEKDVRVAAAADWSSTEIRVQKGQRIVIEATGEVDLGGSQRSSPGGIPKTDSRKLMANRPTGALIAVIGDDNDNFIFIGKQADFTATNNGILFLSINEGDLKDNTGSFIASVKIFPSK